MNKSRREVWGWCLFDVANSSYTTLIITVAYGVIFSKLVVGPDADGSFRMGNALWAWALSVSWGVVAVAGPLLGGLSDRRAIRKRLLAASVILCVVASFLLRYCGPGQVWPALFLICISNIGYALSENFIAAFLPHVVSKQETGRISGLSWGIGYLGGLASVILAQMLTGLDYQLENWDRLSRIGPIVAVFFAVASLPSLLWLKEPKAETRGGQDLRVLADVFAALKSSSVLAKVLLSCFFFQGGVAIVISFTALYAEQEMGLAGNMQAILFLSLQISAALGAFFFGWLQSYWQPLRVLNATLYLWMVALVGIALVKPILGADGAAPWVFLALANFAGLGLGATQSCGRVLVALTSSEEESGTHFGLWGMSVKLAQVVSLVLFGTVQMFFPIQQAMLMCVVFFAVPLIVHRSIDPKHFSVS
jgi:MFS transporter, UMF1 family